MLGGIVGAALGALGEAAVSAAINGASTSGSGLVGMEGDPLGLAGPVGSTGSGSTGGPPGWLGNLAGGVLSTAGTMKLQDWFADSNARDAYKRSQAMLGLQDYYNEDLYSRRYQMTVEDMRKAGLNPILAATGGFSVGSGPSVGLPSVSMAQSFPGQPFGSSARDYADVDRTMRETERVTAETEKVMRQALTEGARFHEVVANTYESRARTGLAGAQERKTVEEVLKVEQEVREIGVRIYRINAEIEELGARRALEVAETENVKEQLGVIQNEKELMSNKVQELMFRLSELAQTSDVYKGPIGKAITYTREIIRSLGLLPAIGAGAGALFRGIGRAPTPEKRLKGIVEWKE